MRCLIDARVLNDPSPGGVTRVARQLIEKMKKDPALQCTILDSRFSILGIPLPNKLLALLTWLRLTSIDRPVKGRYDRLFLPNIAMVGKPKIPYTLLIHDLSFLIEPRWFSWKSRLWHRMTRAKELMRGATTLLAVSEHTKQDLVRLLDVPSEHIQVIPLSIDVHSIEVEPLPKELVGARYFLMLGAGDQRKNIECVIAAFEELKKEAAFADVKLVTCGEGNRPSDALLGTLQRHASALLYPSWYEGFGLPLHDAAAFGTPVIASTAGALPETAPPKTIFVPPFKPHLWNEALRRFSTKK